MQVSRSLPMHAQLPDPGQRTAMSFDVDPRRHAMTVRVVDRSSGEVLQKLVYDKPAAPRQPRTGRAGALVDVEA